MTDFSAKAQDSENCPTAYFHGQPGSVAELSLFGGTAPPGWFVPDRSPDRLHLSQTACFDRIADQIRTRSPDRTARLVGFSIGAYVALEVASRLPDLDLSIDLVSPAVPLSTGPYLETMAGKAVFALAGKHRRLFGLVSRAQGIMARIFPGTLCDLLFASAQGGDAILYADPAFRARVRQLVRGGLAYGNPAYRQEVLGYVGDWAGILQKIDQPVTIWQGQCDNWSPPAMAETLATLLPNVVAVHRLEGCSHYSTLRDYLHSAR